jgi:bifunctional DNA-binding transcriptional regulator/antitoxin component of YhaV-PrlF toxin-antitoxin module
MATDSRRRVIQPLIEGQVSIPETMRHALGLDDSTLIELRLDGDRLIISKPEDDESDDSVRIYTDEEIARFLEEDKIDPGLAAWAEEYIKARRR